MLVFKGKAEVIEDLDKPLRSAASQFVWPHVIRLLSYVRVPKAVQRKISRRALFARDEWRCQYCGSDGKLTLDHVVPRSRGGLSVWENVVASCAPCNLRKGNRTPAEVQMNLRRPPQRPHAGAVRHARRVEDPGRLAAVPLRVRVAGPEARRAGRIAPRWGPQGRADRAAPLARFVRRARNAPVLRAGLDRAVPVG